MLTRILDVTRDERGITLIEVLVSLAAGSIICVALVATLTFTTKQQARLSSAVQANQLSRTTMTKIVDELHSACLAPEFTPIQKGSSGTSLSFINAYSEAPVISESKPEAYKQIIEWKESTGKLVNYTYPSNGGNWPKFTFSETATPSGGTVLATNVTQNKSGGKAVPMFQYYAYTTTSSNSTESALSMLEPKALEAPLSEANAAKSAAVLINFKTAVGVKGKEEERPGGRTVELSDLVTLAFSAPKSESVTSDGPCQ
ncbi:MAG TPA: type II secretion system protein [Solirubrobacteraceae bacterium]|jgi:type II secretory pathway pseudopilin PulG